MKKLRWNRGIQAALAAAGMAMLVGCGQAQEEPKQAEQTQEMQQDGAEDAQKAGTGSSQDVSAEGGEESGQKGLFESFTAQDLEGNPVTEEIFADYDLTVINLWATYCGPCLSEMPDLGELSREYQDKGVQIIGICTDTVDYDGNIAADQVELARQIAADTGADYLHLVPAGDLALQLLPQVQVVPTTVFVDKDGKQLGGAVAGAKYKEGWAEYIEKFLQEQQ